MTNKIPVSKEYILGMTGEKVLIDGNARYFFRAGYKSLEL